MSDIPSGLFNAAKASELTTEFSSDLRNEKFAKTRVFLDTTVRDDILNACQNSLYEIKYGINNLKTLYVYKNYQNDDTADAVNGSIYYELGHNNNYTLNENSGYLYISWGPNTKHIHHY